MHWEDQCVVLWYGKGLMQSCLIPLCISVCDTTIKYVTFSHVSNKNGGTGSKISPALRCQKLLIASQLLEVAFYLGLNLGYKKQWIQKRMHYTSVAAKICPWKTLEWVTCKMRNSCNAANKSAKGTALFVILSKIINSGLFNSWEPII